MKKHFFSMVGIVLAGAMSAQAAITTISLGNTTVSVNNQVAVAGTNNNPSNNGVNPGGLFNMTFNGISLYDPWDAARNNGFALGTTNFADNYIGAPLVANVTVSGLTSTSSEIQVTGTYLNGVGGSALGTWTRTYTLLANGIVREVVSFQNTSGGALTNLRLHGAFDPDENSNTSTTNSQGFDGGSGYNFARAILQGGVNAFLASNDADVRIGFFFNQANGSRGFSATCLDTFLSGGTCTGLALTGASALDAPYAWARDFASVSNGQSVSTTVYHVFATGGAGLNVTDTLNLIGNPPPPPPINGEIPEPGTWALMGSALVGFGVIARRRLQNA